MNIEEYDIMSELVTNVEALIAVTHMYIIHPNEEILREYMKRVDDCQRKVIYMLETFEEKETK